MKILTVFGSSSDERIYAPFVEALGKNHDVQMEVVSAHRETYSFYDPKFVGLTSFSRLFFNKKTSFKCG